MTKTLEMGTPEKRGAGWFVPSGSAGVGYHMEWCSDGRWRCTCPSFRWRKTGTCKHISGGQEGGGEGVTRRDDPGRLLEQSTGGVAGNRRLAVNQTTQL